MKGKRRLSPGGIVLILLLAISLTIAGAGAYRLLRVDQTLDTGARQIRQSLLERTKTEQTQPVQNGGDSTAVGLLILRDDPNTAMPVYYGTEADVLEKGAGQAEGTAELNTPGNAVLFGHRDSAFRELKNLSEQDGISLETGEGVMEYRVERIYITTPEDPAIFEETDATTLTLVTCYPFTFVGPAPQRYVVVAVAEEESKAIM